MALCVLLCCECEDSIEEVPPGWAAIVPPDGIHDISYGGAGSRHSIMVVYERITDAETLYERFAKRAEAAGYEHVFTCAKDGEPSYPGPIVTYVAAPDEVLQLNIYLSADDNFAAQLLRADGFAAIAFPPLGDRNTRRTTCTWSDKADAVCDLSQHTDVCVLGGGESADRTP